MNRWVLPRAQAARDPQLCARDSSACSLPLSGPSLSALTAAALALPGLTPTPSRAADGDAVNAHYGFYEEGERQAVTGSYRTSPIRNDNLQAAANLTLLDRLKLTLNFTQDTWSGATPISTAPYGAMTIPTGASPAYVTNNANLAVDKALNFYRRDAEGNYVRDARTIHMLASASPETRKQGDFALGYEWDEAAVSVAGGLSVEHDYESRFGSLSGRLDFNQKLTTLSGAVSYTGSDVRAVPNAAGLSYIDKSLYATSHEGAVFRRENDTFVFRGEREDWSARLGLTQVVSKQAVLDTSISFTRSSGFLENPYKVATFIFVNPDQTPDPVDGLLRGFVQPVLENRPEFRHQWAWNTRYAHYVPALGAALHFDYRFYSDDWGVNAHTFEFEWGQAFGDGWTLTPRLRYYSQDAADFYQPYYVFNQSTPKSGPTLDYGKIPIQHFSSDHRLSGFGALSGGVTISKVIARGAAQLEAGVEYYTHEGGLKLGGGGEDDYADFDSILMNVGLRINLSPSFAPVSDKSEASAKGMHADSGHAAHSTHDAAHTHTDRGPAGVMLDHMLSRAGDYMFGYRYQYGRQTGATLTGTEAAADAAIVTGGCESAGCGFTPQDMSMHMHMLDLMYAPTDWLNLMLMPQIMDMDMTLRPLAGGVVRDDASHSHHGSGSSGTHTTGGLGDTRLYALTRLFDGGGHHAHAGFGISAPTGDVTQTYADGSLQHYHMQLGSGTWDFLPSLTYTGSAGRWSWGAQANGVVRLEEANSAGFAFGNLLQVSGWGGVRLTDWLNGTVRGIYTAQDAISGRYNGRFSASTPADYPGNYGGQYWDLGLGLSVDVPSGPFRGNRLSIEWLQPLQDDVNGFQLERVPGLSATWSVMF